MDRRLGVGVVGCGSISRLYLAAARRYPVLNVRAVADLDPTVALARAAEFDLEAMSVDALMRSSDVEVIVNLTVPTAHARVDIQAIDAGKHVYSEKPLAISTAEGRQLLALAQARGVRIGCAPDTFLGGGHQASRRVVDSGELGSVVGGTAFFACGGHERWHPNPDFYYAAGGGPSPDMGPYYVTALVNLLGPVRSVTAVASKARSERIVGSGPRAGEAFPVSVFTHVAGALTFRSGAIVQVTFSFDVPIHSHRPIELYGSSGALRAPDPDYFGGLVEFRRAEQAEWNSVAVHEPYADGNQRSLGLADMAFGIINGRVHRANGELALHVLEILEALHLAADSGKKIDIESAAERPAPLETSLVDRRLAA